jgi:hypothetical protein
LFLSFRGTQQHPPFLIFPPFSTYFLVRHFFEEMYACGVGGFRSAAASLRVLTMGSSLFSNAKSRQQTGIQQRFSSSQYDEVYARWKRDPQRFWEEAAEKVKWFKRWDKVFDQKSVVQDGWFRGKTLLHFWQSIGRVFNSEFCC